MTITPRPWKTERSQALQDMLAAERRYRRLIDRIEFLDDDVEADIERAHHEMVLATEWFDYVDAQAKG